MSNKQGRVFVISGPAGVGKTTLAKMVTEEFPNIKTSVSCTTRLPRKGEVDGVHYYFLSEKEFQEKVAAGDFLEYVTLYGHSYGTSRQYLEEELQKGHDVILVIDTQGALLLKEKKLIDAAFIFIMPPSIEELEKRLTRRATENHEVIQKRVSIAKEEIEKSRFYDYVIINQDLNEAYAALRSIITLNKEMV